MAIPNKYGIEANVNMGWIANLELSDRKVKETRITGNTVSKVLEGTSVSTNICYKGCVGYGQTYSLDKKYHTFELGVGYGKGGSFNLEKTKKTGDLWDEK